MRIKPLGDRVVLRMLEAEEKQKAESFSRTAKENLKKRK